MNIIGIDLGSQKAAYTSISGDISDPKFQTKLITATNAKDSVEQRFSVILTSLKASIEYYNPELVICEYPFNIQGHARILVEMFGVIRYHCLINDIPFVVLPQTKIKKYITGSGKAEKSDIRMQVYKEFNLDLSEDEADSFWIAHMGMTYLYGTDKQFRQTSIDDMRKPKTKKSKGGKKND